MDYRNLAVSRYVVPELTEEGIPRHLSALVGWLMRYDEEQIADMSALREIILWGVDYFELEAAGSQLQRTRTDQRGCLRVVRRESED